MDKLDTSTVTADDYFGDMDFSDLTPAGDAAETETETDTETDADAADSETAEPAEADQPKDGDAKEKETDKTETGTEPAGEQTKTFKLRYMDEDKEVSEEEAISLAQKGMDYDRIRQKYDERKDYDDIKSKLSQTSEQLSYFSEMATAHGMTLDQLIENSMADDLMEKQGITDKAFALERVKFERDKRKFEAEKAAKEKTVTEQQTAEARKQADIEAFQKAYPDVFAKLATDKGAIPASVWAEVGNGVPLAAAYAKYEAAQIKAENEKLKAEAEQAKQKQKNKARSTGSQTTKGEGSKRDLIDELWDTEF